MTLKLSRDLIANPQLLASKKEWLSEHLQKQLSFQIQLLQTRLPAGHRLKDILNRHNYSAEKMHPGSVELQLFVAELKSVELKQIPRQLHYIMTNIEGFIDLQHNRSEEANATRINIA